MKSLNRAAAAAVLALSICAPLCAVAAPAAGAHTWTEGVNYFLISPARPTSVPAGKVEVTEVFSYACPACNIFQPTMHKLKQVCRPMRCSTTCPRHSIPRRTGRCFNWRTSPLKFWVLRIRPTMRCSTRCGRAATWPSSTRPPKTQEPHADHRGCGKVLQDQSRRARRQIHRHLKVVLGGCESACSGGPASAYPSITPRPSSSTASIDCT